MLQRLRYLRLCNMTNFTVLMNCSITVIKPPRIVFTRKILIMYKLYSSLSLSSQLQYFTTQENNYVLTYMIQYWKRIVSMHDKYSTTLK